MVSGFIAAIFGSQRLSRFLFFASLRIIPDMRIDSYDFVVVGAGAAGLAAAQYGSRCGLNTVLFDASCAGGQALNIPSLENYPGLFPCVQGQAFIENMSAQAKHFGAEFFCENVISVRQEKEAQRFTVTTDSKAIAARAVLIASGAEHKKLNVIGEQEFSGRGVSYCAVCDGPFFKRKKIFVAGGGDSGCEQALFLSSLSDQVTLVHRRDRLKAQEVIQRRLFQNKSVTVRFNSVIKAIKGDTKVRSLIIEDTVSGKTQEAEADAVFIFVGLQPKSSLVPQVEKDEDGFIITNERMETSIPGLFAAGDVRSKPFRQLITAASDGAVAALQAHEYISARNSTLSDTIASGK